MKPPLRLRDALRAQGLNVHLIGRATKTKIELDQDYIDERLPVAGKEMIYRQVENSFTQAKRRHEYSDVRVGAGGDERLKRRSA
ncbi:tRNA (uracil-5)-methyltransferase [Salmonella enterica subsp. enterica]|uniref:tRNA (Uracil-5)-methyltransferase n=1 Tax=Salmonella enterica I TaxID=59201 RepID=A0A3S4IMF3_SALET|nr:tRNA (uracil-5)-methyltransferase [Salmonella enterica subsp. enterica]